ncbi:MAG: hypothetical protein ACOZB0_01390 [Pseudomonadota bacterium]
MNPSELNCWKCGENLRPVPLPYGRRAECPACHAELHVCRMCRHHAPGKAKACMEPMADEVKDKTRANFCEWFQPAASSAVRSGGRAALDDLFGLSDTPSTPAQDPRKALDDLFD